VSPAPHVGMPPGAGADRATPSPPAVPLRGPVRVPADRLRPGHTVRLEYGQALTLDAREVVIDAAFVRLVGWLAHPGQPPHTYVTDSRHRPDTWLAVVADRNQPPGPGEPMWHDLDRVMRHWADDQVVVWLLDDPDEPLGHGGRLCGTVHMTPGGWRWEDAYRDIAGDVAGSYLDAERALLDAAPSTVDPPRRDSTRRAWRHRASQPRCRPARRRPATARRQAPGRFLPQPRGEAAAGDRARAAEHPR
jgi:hypothetical protein